MALTDVKVRNAKPADKPLKLTDGNGMHLLIHPNGSKYWRLQYRFAGKQKLLALGVYPAVSLADARNRRDDARRLIAAGIDPSEKKKSEKVEQSGALAFESVARDWHASNINWSETHAERVLNSLTNHVFPVIGKRNITDLKTRDLLQPIKAAEKSGHLEIAVRLQQRITAIMRYAVHSSIIDSNPAQDLAGAIATAKRVHRPALLFERITELLSRIESYRGRHLTRLAVRLTLLTFVRSSEMRFARWSEIDFKNALWTIPAERDELQGVKHSSRGSKMKTPHLVPLRAYPIRTISLAILDLGSARNPHVLRVRSGFSALSVSKLAAPITPTGIGSKQAGFSHLERNSEAQWRSGNHLHW